MRYKQRSAHFYRTKTGKEPAKEWFNALKNKVGLVKILARIRRAEMGNFGHYRRVGEGVSELKIDHGPGYRIYYGIDGLGDFIILLVAGDKSSQEKDIAKAKSYWQDYKKRREI